MARKSGDVVAWTVLGAADTLRVHLTWTLIVDASKREGAEMDFHGKWQDASTYDGK